MNEISIENAMDFCHKKGLYPRLEEHNAKIRADAIDECISKIDMLEQISFGIVDVGLVKLMLEELKEKK